jgi:hypothetical protein
VVFENKVLWEALGVRESGQQEASTERSVMMCSPDISRVMISRRMGWACGIMREKCTQVVRLTGKRPL